MTHALGAIHTTPKAVVEAFKSILPPQPTNWTLGIVTALAAGPPTTVSVSVRGGEPINGMRTLAPYSPTIGDHVLIAEWPTERGSDYLVINKLNA